MSGYIRAHDPGTRGNKATLFSTEGEPIAAGIEPDRFPDAVASTEVVGKVVRRDATYIERDTQTAAKGHSSRSEGG